MDFAQLLHAAPVTSVLLIANVLVGVYTMTANPELISQWSFRPAIATRPGERYRWLSAGFVHAGLAHLAFNMITLFYFGPPIESLVGPVRFGIIYFGSELAANALTYWRHKGNPAYSAVGASGAISGVLFSFCLFQPFATLGIMFIIPMWAIVFAPLYIVLSIYAAKQGGGRIAHEAHLGGAIGGLVLTILLYPESISIFIEQVASRFG